MRPFLAVLAGFLLWSLLWVGGHQAALAAAPSLYQADGVPTSSAALLGYLAFSIACSLAAGWLARRVSRAGGAVVALGVVLLAVGIAVQATVWTREPLWFHLPFLALLVPACVLGGRLAASASPARA